MACSASTPAVRQKRPKQASTACHASSMQGVTASARDVIVLVMTLLSFKASTPGAYGSGQATPLRLFQHRSGHSPRVDQDHIGEKISCNAGTAIRSRAQ